MRFSSQITKLSFVAAAALAIATLPSHAFAACGTEGNPCNASASVSLDATLAESLTLSTGSVSTVNFTLVDGQTVAGSAAVPVATSWVLLPGRTSVKVYGYFASSTAALTDGYTTPDNIPSADVLADGGSLGTTFTAFSSTYSGVGTASASLLLDSVSISSSNWVGNHSDNINLEIATPSELPAGSYTGTLTFQAQAD
jgi:hypothetical protein